MNVMVFGLGLSGISASRLSISLGHKTCGVDRLPEPSLPEGFKALKDQGLEYLSEADAALRLPGTELIVLSPGIPADHPLIREARTMNIPVIGEIEWGFMNCKGRIVGITGSNGKSTTTALAFSLLKNCGMDARMGGNIGTAFCDIVDGSSESTIFVLELSSFQLETVRDFRADVAVLLNVTPDHQDRYRDFNAYAEAKAGIFDRQDGTCNSILNLNDPLTAELTGRIKGNMLYFSLTPHRLPGAFLSGGDIIFRDASGKERMLFSPGDLAIKGPHNVENAMAACMAAVICGGEADRMREGLRKFRALPHRLELFSEAGGISVYNDSKATNIDSVLKALASFEGGVILLLGGKDKGADFKLLAPEILKRCRKVVAFGGASGKIAGQLGKDIEVVAFDTLKEATAYALSTAGPGDTVLLSPACASFDEFKNYEDRGDRFKEYVSEAVKK